MSWFTKISGSSTNNVAEVDASNQLKVVLSSTAAGSGYIRNADRDGNAAQFSDHGRQKVGIESSQFYDPIDGPVVNTNLWAQSQLTMTQAIVSGFLVINSGSSTAINTYSIINSIRMMPFLSHFPLYFHVKAKTPNVPQANATIELGMGTVATTAAPTDGAFFRWGNDGTFRCVVNNAGAESSATVTAPSVNDVHTFVIVYGHNSARFEIDGAIVATVSPAIGLSALTSVARLVNFARVYTGGALPTIAPQLSIGEFVVAQMDVNWSRRWGETLTIMGRGSYQSPITPFLQTANHANSTSPVSAALSNTAAGYVTLGGRYQFAAPAGAATDFVLFGFQVPAGYTFIMTDIRISAMNTGVAVAGTATILDWSVAVNSSGVSLATAEAAGTAWAPRRIPLDMQGFLIGAAVGASATTITANVDAVCDSARFIQVVVQVPTGTATAGQFIRGNVKIGGYFE